MKKTIIICGIALLLTVAGVKAITMTVDELKELQGQEVVQEEMFGDVNFVYYAGDVIGTRTGTSTSPVGFYGNHTATTSVIKKVGNNYSDYTFTVKAVNASSSADLTMSILASNDYDCDTSTTTTSLADTIVTGDINWFDVGGYVKELAGSQTLSAGTSTIAWDTSGGADTGRQFTLTDVNAECIRFDMNGSSTEAWVQMKLK